MMSTWARNALCALSSGYVLILSLEAKKEYIPSSLSVSHLSL